MTDSQISTLMLLIMTIACSVYVGVGIGEWDKLTTDQKISVWIKAVFVIAFSYIQIYYSN